MATMAMSFSWLADSPFFINSTSEHHYNGSGREKQGAVRNGLRGNEDQGLCNERICDKMIKTENT